MRRRLANTAVRDQLAEEFEELHARYGHLEGCPFGPTAVRLRGRQPVEVSGWQISEWVPGVDLDGRYLLGEDDTITEILIHSTP